MPVENASNVYAVLYGGPYDGDVLALPPPAVAQLELAGHLYIARHADPATRTIVYVLHENGLADQAGVPMDGHGK